MQVKKFEAPTIQEALEHVKRELGPEAIILQTKRNRRGFGLMSKGSVEVTAAVSERSLQKKQFVETRLPESSKKVLNKLPAVKQADAFDKYTNRQIETAKKVADHVELSKGKARITATRYIDIPEDSSRMPATSTPSPTQSRMPSAPEESLSQSQEGLEEEVRSLKKVIEEMKTAKEFVRSTPESPPGNNSVTKAALGAQSLLQQSSLDVPALQSAFEQLVINGIDRRYALALIRKVAFDLGHDQSKNADQVLDSLAGEIMESVEVSDPLSFQIQESNSPGRQTARLIALIGPTGVGKSTTVAKIAQEASAKRHLKVGLINVDSHKLAAFDQLAIYAKILKMPFRSVSTAEDLRAVLLDFQSLDLVLLDTTGRSQRDPDALREAHAVLKDVPFLHKYLVLSATTRDLELYDSSSRFSVFQPEGLIISKLDEAMVYGGIYNIFQKTKLPLLYFTTGQKVPDDIEVATPERVAALVMDI